MILAPGAAEVAAKGGEGQGSRARVVVEEGFDLYGPAFEGADITEGEGVEISGNIGLCPAETPHTR